MVVEMVRKMDRATFLFMSASWNAISILVQTSLNFLPEITATVTTIGNLFIVWIGTECKLNGEGQTTKDKDQGSSN